MPCDAIAAKAVAACGPRDLTSELFGPAPGAVPRVAIAAVESETRAASLSRDRTSRPDRP
jgi:hypothetical protein